ncbi:MAG: hypothetical protein WC882_04275 [Candidatus Gracilibacteria bacterium]
MTSKGKILIGIFCGVMAMVGVSYFVLNVKWDLTQVEDSQQMEPWNIPFMLQSVWVEAQQAGESFITFIESEGIGKIAVQIQWPETPRYSDQAPVVVYAPTFLTSGANDFDSLHGLTDLGFIQIGFLYPGQKGLNGIKSEGEEDYGGPDSVRAFRDVLKFASGELTDMNGRQLDELSSIVPDYDNVGIFAFSHPGISSTAVLGTYGEALQSVSYFVGRENPTEDSITTKELGYFESDKTKPKKDDWPVYNPFYHYPEDYSPTGLNVDYSAVRWDVSLNRPYFDVNGNAQDDQGDFLLDEKTPHLFGKRCYSANLTQALVDNDIFTAKSWPADLATPEEAYRWWAERESISYYPLLKESMPDLKVMLVFGAKDHVQPTTDNPHTHQAYDGFHETAGLWIRLNPDDAYVALLSKAMAENYVEHDANTEPEDWILIKTWALPHSVVQSTTLLVDSIEAGNFSSLAALAEMADRTHMKNWENDLSAPLVSSEILWD